MAERCCVGMIFASYQIGKSQVATELANHVCFPGCRRYSSDTDATSPRSRRHSRHGGGREQRVVKIGKRLLIDREAVKNCVRSLCGGLRTSSAAATIQEDMRRPGMLDFVPLPGAAYAATFLFVLFLFHIAFYYALVMR